MRRGSVAAGASASDIKEVKEKIESQIGAVGLAMFAVCDKCATIIIDGNRLPNGMKIGGASHIADAAATLVRDHPGALHTINAALDKAVTLQLIGAVAATVVPIAAHHAPGRRRREREEATEPEPEDNSHQHVHEDAMKDFRPTVVEDEGGPLPGQLT